MRLKLDENLPEAARLLVAALGHDVDTVIDEGLKGAGDPDVLAAAIREQRFVVTLDRGFGDVVDTHLAAIRASPSSVLSTRTSKP